jgi:opacity protein-like surface antigen
MKRLLLAAVAAIAFASAAYANLLTNGDFEAGTLAAWIVYDSDGGSAGEPFGLPDVVSFDVTGGGASDAARFKAGTHNLGTDGGGGIQQSIATGAGILSLSVDYAANNSGGNADAGTFALLLDGNVVDSAALGDLQDITRGVLSADVLVGAGSHIVGLQVERVYSSDCGFLDCSPLEYFDNASATQAVPEPASLGLLGLGVAGLGLGFRRKASRQKRSVQF